MHPWLPLCLTFFSNVVFVSKGKSDHACAKRMIMREAHACIINLKHVFDFDCRALLGMVPKKQKVVQSFSFRKRRFLTLNKRRLGNG
jgi:hypothetical protein